MKTIENKVKTLKTTDVQTFLSWEFNTLKDKNRDVTNLKNAIVKNGFSFPVFLWYGHNYVIDGTGRRKAVEELTKEGYEIPEIPYVEVEAKTIEEARQKVLEASSSFGDISKKSFLEFVDGDITFIDWETINFGGSKKLGYDDFLKDGDDDDDAPEMPIEAQSQYGDLYELGGHRLLCGDSTLHTDLAKLMDGHKADMVFTDPPYNVDYKGSGENTKQGIMNDKMDADKFHEFLVDTFIQMKANTNPQGGCYVFHSHKTDTDFKTALQEVGYNVHTTIIWGKPSAGLGMNDYKTMHEPMFYCSIEKPIFYGDRTNTTVMEGKTLDELVKKVARQIEAEGGGTLWRIARAKVGEYVHPTQKPVDLPVKTMVNSSRKGDIVLDLFLGSGTTLIAAEKTGRKCYGMELDFRFVDVIIERYVNFTQNRDIIKNGKPHRWESPKTDFQEL